VGISARGGVQATIYGGQSEKKTNEEGGGIKIRGKKDEIFILKRLRRADLVPGKTRLKDDQKPGGNISMRKERATENELREHYNFQFPGTLVSVLTYT